MHRSTGAEGSSRTARRRWWTLLLDELETFHENEELGRPDPYDSTPTESRDAPAPCRLVDRRNQPFSSGAWGDRRARGVIDGQLRSPQARLLRATLGPQVA